MRLGDYADGAWMFIATCDTCGRQTRVDPAEVLTHPRTHPHMRVAELAIHLRCRDCRHRTARIDPVVETGKRPAHWTDADHQARAGPAARRGLHGHAVVHPP